LTNGIISGRRFSGTPPDFYGWDVYFYDLCFYLPAMQCCAAHPAVFWRFLSINLPIS